MRKYLISPWVLIPIALSVIFALLFFPIVRQSYEIAASVIFTAIGICVIWGSYGVRAHIFGNLFRRKSNTRNQNQ